MPASRSILLLSNGHGEDIIAATLLRELLKRAPEVEVSVLPIVGEGKAYAGLPVKMLGPRKSLPSGGFMRQNAKNFWMDMRAGLLNNTWQQIQTLRQARQEAELVLCVGDVLLVILVGLFVKRRMVFLPTAKSEYISGHYPIEKNLMRKYAALVLPRDEKTARVLQEAGVAAQFVGNAMMDCFTITGNDFGIAPERKVIGILPGSRLEAYENMRIILQVVDELEQLPENAGGGCFEYLVALADQLALEGLAEVAREVGWRLVDAPELADKGVVGVLVATGDGSTVDASRSKGQAVPPDVLQDASQDVLPDVLQDAHPKAPQGLREKVAQSPVSQPYGAYTHARGIIRLTKGRFGDFLHKSDIFIGLSGTGNEQAVGMGKPLVAFPGTGTQYTEAFMQAQKKLLGDSIAIFPRNPKEVARGLGAILADRVRYTAMGQIGHERMGPTGGVERMVKLILQEFDKGE